MQRLDAVLERFLGPRLFGVVLWAAVPAVLLLALLRFGLIVHRMAPAYAQRDAGAFFLAGRSYLEGLNPYGDAFWQLSEDVYGFTMGAFFNPPYTLPLLAPLGYVGPEMAGLALMILGPVATAAAIALALWMVRGRGFVLAWQFAAAIALFLGLLVFQPLVPTVVYGHIKPAVLLGLVVWAWAARAGWWPLQAVALAVVMALPQFALPLLVVSALVPRWRLAAAGAVAACGALYLLAALPHGIFAFAFDWLSQAGGYSADPVNVPGVLVGASPLLDIIGLSAGAPVTLAVGLAGGFAIWRAGTVDPLVVAMGAAAVGIFAAPTHLPSALLLFPALAYVVASGPLLPRLALGVALTVLGMTDWFVDLDTLFASGGEGIFRLRALGSTAMLVVAFVALMALQPREQASGAGA
ncbi:MAG: glycosyltransferase 87 family protein [Pseudomonadota bacterium]